MKFYLARIRAQLESALFAVFERDVMGNPQKMYEIHQMTGRAGILQNCPSICLPGVDIVDMFRNTFGPVAVDVLKEEEREDQICKRVGYVFNRNMSADVLSEIWGLSQENLNALEAIDSSVRVSDGNYDRWRIEEIIYKYDLYTKKQASVMLGVRDEYFHDVINLIKEKYKAKILYPSMLPQKEDGFIPTDFIDRICNLIFPDKQYDTREEFLCDFELFLNENGLSKCVRKCFISERLSERQIKFPFFIDVLLNMPVSSEFSIPIKNGKPGYLPPDYISFYSYIIAEESFKDKKLFPLKEDLMKSMNSLRM